MRTIKEEEVDVSDYQDYNDSRRQLGRFLDEVSIHKRIHSSLGCVAPAECEDQWRRERALRTLDVHHNPSERCPISGGHCRG